MALAEPAGHLFSPGDLVDRRFRIERLLGTGGMGEVYLADDRGERRQVALKILLPELLGSEKSLTRFAREVKSTQAIDHPGVIEVFDYLELPPPEDRGSRLPIPCLVMEYLEGETLADRLERQGPMSDQEARPIVLQMANALDAAHKAGIVHRDLKPDNVFLVPDQGTSGRAKSSRQRGSDNEASWRVVLTDFGVARRRGAPDSELSGDSLTASNVVIGTPEFMAPELLELEEAIPASDQYALGLVAFEMVTGSRPFEDEQPLKALFMRVRQPAPSPLTLLPELDPDLARVIERCLERRPEDRYESAREIAKELEEDTGTLPVPIPIPVPRWEFSRDHMIAAATLGVMILLVILLVWVYAEPSGG